MKNLQIFHKRIHRYRVRFTDTETQRNYAFAPPPPTASKNLRNFADREPMKNMQAPFGELSIDLIGFNLDLPFLCLEKDDCQQIFSYLFPVIKKINNLQKL